MSYHIIGILDAEAQIRSVASHGKEHNSLKVELNILQMIVQYDLPTVDVIEDRSKG